ncbi:4-hydroxy-tetrahydrodipicolinate synthase [Phycisphaera mikurensis]|uniref:4-hydroxy-tetrahydrodipicolinate synthase n=1 Tax=Phycisphaera mikurensis (strain NBRC 102666 / KCTC 22515 / FYK2301M01) TaxID=1142394 RepID=I0IC99_PHYMF|nr:4-hydroxy-tetrahydrodipicolinate synthase [Phycisphaera mikurensis]MBB6441894.1 4-hydroxy-tetrahydrodipicolinate synthase [Phycisphaera mikurensis]BAM02887.1 dihydrodipicolinate synthase [Phycisphaera mikurensis NBRC 102666]
MFKPAGTFTALITPFRGDEVDFEALRQNVKAQADAGITGVVPCGTTGESPTLSHAEHREVIERTIAAAAGTGMTVMAGTGSNATKEAIDLTRAAKESGADASLLVNPYYNKPSQEGLYAHVMAVADAVEIPIVLYNIPGRTGVTMLPETIERLAAHPHVVADKEATGSLDVASEIRHRCGDGFAVLSGDDSLTLPLMSVGGTGVVSVLSNLFPAEVKRLVDAAAAGDFAGALAQHVKLFPLFRAVLSMAVNPVVIKTAMRQAGLDTGGLRLPLTGMSPPAEAELQRIVGETRSRLG